MNHLISITLITTIAPTVYSEKDREHQGPQTCGGRIKGLIGSVGVIHTPNFPNPFSTPIKCQWVIERVNDTGTISIYFTQQYTTTGLTFTEYLYYDETYKAGERRAFTVTEENITRVKWLQVYNVTWWKEPTELKHYVEFSIGPKDLAKLYKDMEKLNIRFIVLIEDLQSAFDKQKAAMYVRRNMASFNWNNYYRLDDIYAWLNDLSANNPDEVILRRVGTTHENRTILSARLTLRGSQERSKVMIEGGVHAREWISPAFVTYMLHTLLNSRYNRDEELERIAYMYTWIFVPVMNPDGYEYSHTEDRLWRKNRRLGHGVDLNRNYGVAFGAEAECIDERSQAYCGKMPFSEPETYSMAMFAKEHSSKLEYYISFHSFGQYIHIPYGHLMTHEGNYYVMKGMAEKAIEKMKIKHGITYTTGTTYETSGHLPSGTSMDWVKRALNVNYVASVDLPDTGSYGFALPPTHILPSCQATLDGLLEILTPQTEFYYRTRSAARKNKGHLPSGTSMDWVKRALNVNYVASVDLPDTGSYGFALPPTHILPSCQATLDGLLEILTPQTEFYYRTRSAARKNKGHLPSGTSMDWVKRALNVNYVASVDLPDTGSYGFALPPTHILPSCQATLDGLLEILTPQTEFYYRTRSAARKNKGYIKILFLCYLVIYVTCCAIHFLW